MDRVFCWTRSARSLSLARFLSKYFEEFCEIFWATYPLGGIEEPVQLVCNLELDLLAPALREAELQELERGLRWSVPDAGLVAGRSGPC